MTEIDKLKRAQFIIEKLANGIDPITEKLVPEDDTVNNVKISRCFFYVSDILKELINKEETNKIEAKENDEKTEIIDNSPIPKPIFSFQLTNEQLLSLKTSKKNLSSSEIAKYLNTMIDLKTMDKITPNMINSWLMHIGLLENRPYEDGKKRKVPTYQGEEFGISLEKRSGKFGRFYVTTFNEEAQQFIYDNLDAIISFRYKGV
ncbi:MAG: hypothetical protein IJB44_05415 [Clostridia bacterium]|nr:hypothetical protein [Clostridia bacterium]